MSVVIPDSRNAATTSALQKKAMQVKIIKAKPIVDGANALSAAFGISVEFIPPTRGQQKLFKFSIRLIVRVPQVRNRRLLSSDCHPNL